jgi:hypothetical protein
MYENKPKLLDTYRTKCKKGRVTYHPEWSNTQPWVSYINGTAGLHFASIDDARLYFKTKNMHLII